MLTNIRNIYKALYASFRHVVLNIIYIFRRIILSINPSISIGRGTSIELDSQLLTVDKWGCGNINIGANSYIGHKVQLIPAGKGIIIGDNSTINSYTVVYGQGGVSIGNGVRIAAHCVIVPSNHVFNNPNEYIYKQGMSCKGIVIEDDVWIGAGVKILDGVTIAKGCVIGANAVVTHSTEPYGIYVGIPARKIKSRT